MHEGEGDSTSSDVELTRAKTFPSLARIAQTPVSIYQSGPHYSHEFNHDDINVSDVRDVQKLEAVLIRRLYEDVNGGGQTEEDSCRLN